MAGKAQGTLQRPTRLHEEARRQRREEPHAEAERRDEDAVGLQGAASTRAEGGGAAC